MFRINYNCQNGGDGSVSVRLHATQEISKSADEKDLEEYGEGWGENSSGSVELKIKDDKIFYRQFEIVDGKYQNVWKPCEQIKDLE